MISQLDLKNFKVFKQLDELEISPITVLCGTNSCGKTSILQSILLMKQTLEDERSSQTLTLNGDYIRMGYPKDIIFQQDQRRNLSFTFTFEMSRDAYYNPKKRRGEARHAAHYILRSFVKWEDIDKIYEGNVERRAFQKHLIYYKFILSVDKGASNPLVKPFIIQLLEFGVDTILLNGQKVSGGRYTVRRQKSHKVRFDYEQEFPIYSIKWKRTNLPAEVPEEDAHSGDVIAELMYSSLLDISSVLVFDDLGYVDEKRSIAPMYITQKIKDFLLETFTQFSYLGPLREKPVRRYAYDSEIDDIGNKGENAPYIFLQEQTKVLKQHYFYQSDDNPFVCEKQCSLLEAVDRWLSIMNISELRSELQKETIYLRLNSDLATRKTRVSIANVGFGVSQAFPIVLQGLRMPKRGTLLLEQPEIHLHPKLQMQMADYFISLALSDKRILVETHSDHIINRLVRRIVEDEEFNLKKFIKIYFIKPSRNGARFEEIQIDEQRGIVNWPDGFFDQVASEQGKIMRAGLAKRQRNKK
jgi:predicted ATPase